MRKRILITLMTMTMAAVGLAQGPARFDHKVRALFFAGFAGDAASLEKAMAISKETLEAEPKHAEAMVWYGSGLFFQSGALFRKGDQAGGMALMAKGTGMMDEAVALAPRSVGVRIPRGSAYLMVSRFVPPAMGAPMLAKGMEDFEVCWELQKGDLSRFSEHSLGELLFGIGEARLRTGDKDKAAELFAVIEQKLPGTVYAQRVAKWKAGEKFERADVTCAGCHMGSPKVK